ncbi:MAG: JAB domain-containing protein [Mucilaginibacter polytrichastri]|nr:JAB domain-containing protein [Mucilaginibacter polytrichastri]
MEAEHPEVKARDRAKVTSSKDAHQILSGSWDAFRINLSEEFKVMLMNRAGRVLGIVPISSGGIHGTLADPKLIFSAALKGCATSIILCHNHPSGNLKPSQADIALTHKISSGGSLLDITVLDHIILTEEGYLSFADEGLL